MLFRTQFSGLIVSLGLDPSWFWLLLPLPLPVPEVSTVQVLALRTLPLMRCLLGDTFLGRFIPHELCPLINYHVLLIPHILDFKQVRAYISLQFIISQTVFYGETCKVFLWYE